MKPGAVQLSFEQWLQLGNMRLARNIVENVKSLVGPKPSAVQQQALRAFKNELVKEYPGYFPGFGGGVAGVGSKITPGQAVDELRRALEVPTLAESPVGQALRVYLAARDTASRSGETPTTFATANSFRQARGNLRLLASRLIERAPEFSPLWEQVFDRELSDDLE